MAKILVVEDDVGVANAVVDYLESQFHTAEAVATGREAAELLGSYPYDVVVLDLHLPDMDGLDVMRQYRAQGGTACFLILTGKNELPDKEAGLDAGADDYLTKPFQQRELGARIRAILRRSASVSQSILAIGNLSLDVNQCKLTRKGKEIELQPKEYALMEFFMRHPDRIFNADALLDHVWKSDSETTPETLRVHIAKLRGKIDVPGSQSPITTVKGLGYKLDSKFCV